jgi:Co/Zn/Cd efflux system component
MNNSHTPRNDRTTYDPHRANPMGAYVTTGGAVIFLVATFLAWIQTDDKSFSGYEADTVIPFTAYLGIGFSAALLYAAKRATRRQHRGLSLSSMAAGIAATGLALSYVFEVPGGAERKAGFDTEIGVYVGLVGAIVWAIGSFLLAKEPEGDIEHRNDDDRGTTNISGRSSN